MTEDASLAPAEPASSARAPTRVTGARVRTASLAILAGIALVVVAVIAKDLLIPVTLALVLQAFCSPLVQALRRWHIPAALGSLCVIGGLVGAAGGATYYLAEPASRWVQELPNNWELQHRLRKWKDPVEQVQRATAEVENLAKVGTSDASDEPEVKVVISGPESLLENAFEHASSFVAASVVTLVLLFLLLSNDGEFLLRAVQVLSRLEDKKRVARIVRGFESAMSRYLLTVTAINACLGVVIGVAMWLLGVPSPALWGVMAGLLNYVPYLGLVVGTAVVFLVSLLTFDPMIRVLLPPIAYLALSSLEGGLITPAIIGRQLILSPVTVFVWLVLWGWMWGLPGALLAVPILMGLKIVCDQIPSLKPLGAFMARPEPSAPAPRE